MKIGSPIRRLCAVPGRRSGFTLIELLVVIGMIGMLASILLPALARAKAKGQGIFCLNNARQLGFAWVMYADEHNGRLAYNLGGDLTRHVAAPKTNANWVNNILSWELDSDNTNTATITQASLAPYANNAVRLYRCPSDNVLSDVQIAAGWSGRIRSYSMNAMVGDAGSLTQYGYNRNNPYDVQFFSLPSIPKPADIFVFLDEHPDSINDGYFVNRADNLQWIDLPASYHNGAGNFAFSDGHSEAHRWRNPATVRPARPDAAPLPMAISANESSDFEWVTDHMSVDR
jgi:prepilin-type N-terminal cleavage/methylation domain-containing protein/prepilin-type processing-associated H-X9-DG protein